MSEKNLGIFDPLSGLFDSDSLAPETAIAPPQFHREDEETHPHVLYAPGTIVPAEPFVDTGFQWDQPGGSGSPLTITYSYSNLLDGTLGLGASTLRSAVEEALGIWADFAPLNFVEVEDSGPPAGDTSYPAAGLPQLRFGHHFFDGSGGALAHAYFPFSTTNGLAGDVHFDSGDTWQIGAAGGGFDFLEVAVHEIGHTLGLGHEPTSGNTAIMNPFYGGRYSGLGNAFLFNDDINGIRSIYGFGTGSVTPLSPTNPEGLNFLFDDFDPGIDSSQWFQINNGTANDNFGLVANGASQDSDSLFFTGSGTRSAVTNEIDVANGGFITFDLIVGNSSNGGENADLGEDIVLEYSTNGSTWTNLATYNQDSFARWNRISQFIPLAAQSSDTQFRWRQVRHSGANFDNWALDNVEIEAAPVSNTFFDDFDPGIDRFRWSEIQNASANTNFGGSGKSLFFTGGTFGSPRLAATNFIDATSGGTITFDLIFGDGTNGGENVDPEEDVVLQYTADNGTTWSDIAVYDQDTFTSWTRITEDIPLTAQFQAAAAGTDLAFRFMQRSHSGNSFDNWGLDNVEIQATSTLSSFFEDFDPDVNSLQWSDISNGTVNTTFGGVVGSHSLFFSGSGTRAAATNLIDTSNGGNIFFDLIVGDSTNGGENADFGEDVVLQYTLDGSNWLALETYDQNAFTSWTRIDEAIPLDAVQNGSAAFRFIQPNNSGFSFDEWAIDNVAIQETLVESNDTIADALNIGQLDAGDRFSTTSIIGNNNDVGPNDDVDFIAFDLDAGDTVEIDIDARLGFSSPLDSVLRLFNSSGTQLALNDDGTAPGETFTFDSYLTYTAGTSDTYYVGISSFANFNYDPLVEGSGSGFSSGEYEITLSVPGGGLAEPNDTIADAFDIGQLDVGDRFSTMSEIGDNDNLAPQADVDFFAFDLDAGDTVQVDIDAELGLNSPLDSVLRLFDSSGNELAVSDDTPAPGEDFSLDSYISYTAGTSDTYYVGVSSFSNFDYDPFVEGSGSGSSIGDYEITLAVV
ncbi:MAG: matrixin family metalloprotease [Cyanobacteriota bacterium]|nr:matrixin family metalloprotease [Cyanobacteriota bacterium]